MTVRFQSTQKGVQLLTQRLIKFAEKKQQVQQMHHCSFLLYNLYFSVGLLNHEEFPDAEMPWKENQQAAGLII